METLSWTITFLLIITFGPIFEFEPMYTFSKISVLSSIVEKGLIWTLLFILALGLMIEYFEMCPFDFNFWSLNILLIKAKAKYGSSTIMGLQFFGKNFTNLFSIKQA